LRDEFELEGVLAEVVMANFQILPWQFHSGTKENKKYVFMLIYVQYDLNPGPYEYEEGSCNIHSPACCMCVCVEFFSPLGTSSFWT